MTKETNDTVTKDVIPMPVLVYGRPTCEDTAAVRERFTDLGISFVEIDVDSDEDGGRFAESLNRAGDRSTPVIVFGDREFLLVEPTPQELDNALKRAGYKVDSHEMDNV